MNRIKKIYWEQILIGFLLVLIASMFIHEFIHVLQFKSYGCKIDQFVILAIDLEGRGGWVKETEICLGFRENYIIHEQTAYFIQGLSGFILISFWGVYMNRRGMIKWR